MIRYHKGSVSTLFYWWGGINRHLLWPTFEYFILLIFLYYAQTELDILHVEVDLSCLRMLGSLTVFLLVFRLNQSMARNNEAGERSNMLFAELESLVGDVCALLVGSKERLLQDMLFESTETETIDTLRKYAELATATKLHTIRLCIAMAVSFLIHCNLLGAVADNGGLVDEEMMQDLIFLHSRLQALLYAEEMEIIDEAISITCEADPDDASQTLFRTEVGRFRIMGPAEKQLIERCTEKFDDTSFHAAHSGIVVPLPQVILMLLTDVLQQPLGQPWGYPERVLNLVMATADDAMKQVTHLSALISRPVSLAYYQHCRVILLLYAFLYPWSVDSSAGFMDNVVVPFCIFWAMTGLEKLAEMMENPLGSDDTDLHLMEMLHALEASAQQSFEITEADRPALRKALCRIVQDIVPVDKNTPAPKLSLEQRADRPMVTRVKHFEDYFCWMPIPTLILEKLLLLHGQAETTHALYMEGHLTGVRSTLRKTLRRAQRVQKLVQAAITGGQKPTAPAAAAGSAGASYQALGQESDGEGAGQDHVFHTIQGEEPVEQATIGSSLGEIQRDPSFYCHYLAFHPTLSAKNAMERKRQDDWKARCVDILGEDHPAAPLLKKCVDEEDSERSVLLQAIETPRAKVRLCRRARLLKDPADRFLPWDGEDVVEGSPASSSGEGPKVGGKSVKTDPAVQESLLDKDSSSVKPAARQPGPPESQQYFIGSPWGTQSFNQSGQLAGTPSDPQPLLSFASSAEDLKKSGANASPPSPEAALMNGSRGLAQQSRTSTGAANGFSVMGMGDAGASSRELIVEGSWTNSPSPVKLPPRPSESADVPSLVAELAAATQRVTEVFAEENI
eukprot:TRINITY_DN108777_c0_g1_i1.p1 TRINITY_DN108777_c0_g1~~TRINITY_DN108777_c0_g1_i1.p1  ORF type:complete len:849 (+),score=115.76 TRINITY_DN108777_c0_g1_i1:120-2666(+)